MLKTRIVLLVLGLFVLAGWFSRSVFSQGSGSSRSTPPPKTVRPATPDEFYSSFWRHIVKQGAAYNVWTEFPHDGETPESPHGPVGKTYVNKVAADGSAKLPVGSILVREDYDADKRRQSISVMYRVKGSDPDHGDWYWLRYREDGSIVRAPKEEGGKAIAGKVASCIECHAKAGVDFVFSKSAAKSPSKLPE